MWLGIQKILSLPTRPSRIPYSVLLSIPSAQSMPLSLTEWLNLHSARSNYALQWQSRSRPDLVIRRTKDCRLRFLLPRDTNDGRLRLLGIIRRGRKKLNCEARGLLGNKCNLFLAAHSKLHHHREMTKLPNTSSRMPVFHLI